MNYVAMAAVAGVLASVPAQAARSAFGPGEQSTYGVSYLGVVVGEAAVTVGLQMRHLDADVWPVLCTARTLPHWTVFPVNDRYVSFWDPSAQSNVGSDFFIDENKKRRRESVQLQLNEGKATVMRQSEGEAPRRSSYDLDGKSVDMVGAALVLRNTPLQAGGVYERPVFTGAVTFTIRAEVEGKQELKNTALGTREVWRVKVATEFAGQLKTKRAMIVYFTADAAQLPVRVEAEFLLGQMVAELVRYEPGRDLTKG